MAMPDLQTQLEQLRVLLERSTELEAKLLEAVALAQKHAK